MATSSDAGWISTPSDGWWPRGLELPYLLFLFPVTSALVGVNLYHPALLLLVAFLAYRVLVAEELVLTNSFAVVVVLWAVFLLYAATSMLWSPSSDYALSKFLRMATLCTLLLVAPTVLFSSERRVYAFLKLAVYASVAVAVVIVLGYLSPAYPRPYELLGSLSHLAPGRIIGFGVVVAAYYAFASDRSDRRLTHGLLLGVLGLGLVVSGSRGPLLAATLSSGLLIVLVLAVEREDLRLATLFVLGSALAAAGLVVAYLLLGVSIPTFEKILPLLRGEVDPSNQRRFRFYYQGLQLWLQSPLFGSGLGSYGVWIHGVDVEEYPHNVFLEVLSELGVVGLLLYGAFLLATLRSIVASYRRRPLAILLACLFAYALLNASFSQDLQGNRMVYAVVGLATYVGFSGGYESSMGGSNGDGRSTVECQSKIGGQSNGDGESGRRPGGDGETAPGTSSPKGNT